MEHTTPTRLQQIRMGSCHRGYESITNNVATREDYPNEHETFQATLLSKCPAHLWPRGSYRVACPRPILVSHHHEQKIIELSQALTFAVNNIVERWWTDQKARFFERMPLKPEEEGLLKWLDDQVSRRILKRYVACSGSWRPDFLIEDRSDSQDGKIVEGFLITEINARFPFNGAVHLAYGQEALDDVNIGGSKLASTATPTQIFDGLRSLFNPGISLHLLIGEEAGIDIHMFIDACRKRFGITPRLISPSDLRLESTLQGNRTYQLCCLAPINIDTNMFPIPNTFVNSEGEIVEEIKQVGLELHQHELLALPEAILREVSLCCFNDIRTILLVHDKRMLGIVKQELHDLVRTRVLTSYQAHTLNESIADTFIPGSPQLHYLLQNSLSSPNLKSEYVLKPIRSGKGAGIIFGDEITPREWNSVLGTLQSQASFTEQTYVVQRKVKQCLYDLVLHASGEKLHYPLVGTWHVINGKYSGLGVWRSSGNRICAISSGGSIIWSVSETVESSCQHHITNKYN